MIFLRKRSHYLLATLIPLKLPMLLWRCSYAHLFSKQFKGRFDGASHIFTFFCICKVFQQSVLIEATSSQYNVAYVFGGDGIYIIEPETKSLVTKITNLTSPGLCTRGNNRWSRWVLNSYFVQSIKSTAQMGVGLP